MIIVVPARGGSKRVPRKNIYPLGGKPLLAYTLESIQQARLDVPAYVSTEDDEVAKLASSFKGIGLVKRPANISADTSSTESALLHVIDTVSFSNSPQWVVTLPPTSPFRTAQTIQKFIDQVRQFPERQDCLMSVTENRGDFWRMSGDGSIERLFPNAPRRQQEREPLYEENSAIYISRVAALRETGSVLGRKVVGIPISPREAFDINSPEDIKLAEAMLRAGA